MPFWVKTVLLGQEVHYYMVYFAYFTELNLQICDYSQNDTFVAKIVNTRLTKIFCHPGCMIHFNWGSETTARISTSDFTMWNSYGLSSPCEKILKSFISPRSGSRRDKVEISGPASQILLDCVERSGLSSVLWANQTTIEVIYVMIAQTGCTRNFTMPFFLAFYSYGCANRVLAVREWF